MYDVLPSKRRTALQDKQRDLFDRPFRAVCVHRRHRSRMARVDRAQEGVGLEPAQFPEDDPVWPHAQRGVQQILGCDERFAKCTAGGDQPDRIGMMQVKFGRVLDED